MTRVLRRSAVACACLVPLAAPALQCPEMPKQALRDTEAEARSDRVYLEQMLFAAYCSTVRDNAALSEGEREARVLAYRREMH